MKGQFVIAWTVLVAIRASGATLEASPGDNIESMVSNMNAGDTLILHGGTYDISQLKLLNKNGSDSNWTVIRAADGESPAITLQRWISPQRPSFDPEAAQDPRGRER